MSHVHIHFYGITLHVMKFVKQANGKLGNVLPVRSSELGRRGDHRREVHSCLHNKGPCLCPCPCHSPCPCPCCQRFSCRRRRELRSCQLGLRTSLRELRTGRWAPCPWVPCCARPRTWH